MKSMLTSKIAMTSTQLQHTTLSTSTINGPWKRKKKRWSIILLLLIGEYNNFKNNITKYVCNEITSSSTLYNGKVR